MSQISQNAIWISFYGSKGDWIDIFDANIWLKKKKLIREQWKRISLVQNYRISFYIQSRSLKIKERGRNLPLLQEYCSSNIFFSVLSRRCHYSCWMRLDGYVEPDLWQVQVFQLQTVVHLQYVNDNRWGEVGGNNLQNCVNPLVTDDFYFLSYIEESWCFLSSYFSLFLPCRGSFRTLAFQRIFSVLISTVNLTLSVKIQLPVFFFFELILLV